MTRTAKARDADLRKLLVSFLAMGSVILSQPFLLEHGFNTSAISLTSGLALGLVLAWGLKQLYAVFPACLIGSLLGSETFHASSLAYSTLFSFGIALQSAAIFLGCKQFSKTPSICSNHRSFIIFSLSCLAVTLMTSILMLANKSAFLTHEVLEAGTAMDLVLSNLAGTLLLAPLTTAILRPKQTIMVRSDQRLEKAAWLALFIGLTGYASLHPQHSVILMAPMLIWSGIRFSPMLCSLGALATTLAILPALSTNFGVSSSSVTHWLSGNESYLIWLLLALASIYLNILLSDKLRSEQQLEQIVEQRTMDLSLANQELKDEIFVREQAERSQRSTSKRYRALIETAGIPIIVLDQNICIRQWNRAAESTFGYSRDQILGKNFVDYFIPESQQDEMAWKLTRVIESGINQDNIESEAIGFDSVTHTMLWNINQLPGGQEESAGKRYLLIGQNISDIRKTQDQLHYLAHFDSLTGCANRRLFEDRCAQAIQSAIRHKHNIALIGLDIDHFKRINDTLGHDAGDAFLVELAKRLKECVRREDTIARLGGDEFAVLLANVNGQEGAEVVARNMLETITQPIMLKSSELVITSSIGITLCPADGTHYPDLLKNADMAMYRAKNAGRNNIQFYSPEMNEEMQRQLQIEQELRTALKEQQFELYYQPIVDIESGAVVALEALLRWQHPHRGMLRPSYFLQVAEQSGLLHEIGEWSLKQTCKEGKDIQTFSTAPIQIALNLSSRQYNHPNLVPMVRETTATSGFDPRNLILEMSENTITTNTDRSIAILQELSQLGISLTIDGFGTGLSSLRQIKQIPIDIIKIDRSFVTGIPEDQNDMTIAETLLTVATQMELKTFATGVETKEQEAFLKINGCRYAQGYLYSAPLPFSKLANLFKSIDSGEALRAGDQIYLPFSNKNLH